MDSYYRQRQQLSNGSATETGFPVGLIIFFHYTVRNASRP